MNVPTQPVTINLADFGGPAIAGVKVTARLSDFDYTSTGVFVSTEPVEGLTDALGVVVLNLFPNAMAPTGLGTRGTTVTIIATPPRSKTIKVEAQIPDAPCNLADVLVNEDAAGIAYVPPVQMQSYTALRNYGGNRTAVYITQRGIGGLFMLDAEDTTTADDGGTVIVGVGGRRWKRAYDGLVNLKWFGAAGDGVTDDTTARNLAFDFCINARRALLVPYGRFRVTSGYTNATTKDLALFGENPAYNAGTAGTDGGSCFVLDSTDPASFFYHQSASNELLVDKVRFACAQTVTDRKFFRVSASSVKHTVNEAHFVSVEQPFVFDAGCYMQMSSYRNIRFTNSGSFHSKAVFSGGVVLGGTLMGTLLVIDNCDVEGFIPANTEKIVCNLSGFRHIRTRNFLIEPGLPAAGWTALKTRCAFGLGWNHYPDATHDGLYIECTTFEPTYVVEQVGNTCTYNDSHLNLTPTSRFRLDDDAKALITTIPLTGSGAYKLDELFSFGDTESIVVLRNSQSLNMGASIYHPQIIFEDAAAGSGYPGISFDNKRSQVLWEFDGSYVDPGKVLLQAFAGSVYPSTDATYGRKLVFVAGGGTTFNTLCQAKLPGALLGAASQGWVALLIKLPTWTAGSLEVPFYVNSANIGSGGVYTAVDSGTTKWLILPAPMLSAGATHFGFAVNGVLTGLVGNVELLYAAIGMGRSLPNIPTPNYQANVVTWAAAMPTVGSWTQGDKVMNTGAAIDGIEKWVRLTTGSGHVLGTDWQADYLASTPRQPLDATLTSLAALAIVAGKIPYGTGADTFGMLDLDADGSLAANSDTRVATQKAVKTYADALIAAQDAMVFKGVINCSTNPNYPAADRGHTYRVSVAGKIGGASGVNVEAGDMVLCTTDATAAGDQATVGANWAVIQTNIDGAVVGPSSAVGDNIASFDGITGKLIKDSGKALPSGTIVGHTDTQTLSNKTLVTPIITGTAYTEQGAPTSKAAAATLTIAELLTRIIEYTGAAATLTLPTGANIDAGVLAGLAADRAFEFAVINTGSGTATIGTAAGLTLVGAMTVAAGASGQFRVRKTAASTYTVYRVA